MMWYSPGVVTKCRCINQPCHTSCKTVFFHSHGTWHVFVLQVFDRTRLCSGFSKIKHLLVHSVQQRWTTSPCHCYARHSIMVLNEIRTSLYAKIKALLPLLCEGCCAVSNFTFHDLGRGLYLCKYGELARHDVVCKVVDVLVGPRDLGKPKNK